MCPHAHRIAIFPRPSHRQTSWKNEPDTDFDLPQNQEWVRSIFSKWKKDGTEQPEIIPLQIGAKRWYAKAATHIQTVVRTMKSVSVKCRRRTAHKWRKSSKLQRQTLPDGERPHSKNATGSCTKQPTGSPICGGDLIGCMCAVTGKTVIEGDVEVSEAVDYARFYTTAMKKFAALDDVEMKPKGTILVISPWNFPCAILWAA